MERSVPTAFRQEVVLPGVSTVHHNRLLVVREHVALFYFLCDTVHCPALPRHQCALHLSARKEQPRVLQICM